MALALKHLAANNRFQLMINLRTTDVNRFKHVWKTFGFSMQESLELFIQYAKEIIVDALKDEQQPILSNIFQDIWNMVDLSNEGSLKPFIKYTQELVLHVLEDKKLSHLSDILIQQYRIITRYKLAQKTLPEQWKYLQNVDVTEMKYIKHCPEVAEALETREQAKALIIIVVIAILVYALMHYLKEQKD